VVLLDDKEIKNERGAKFPTLSLSSRIDINHYERYSKLVNNRNRIPCEYQISNVDDITISTLIERMMINRLERKTKDILDSYKNTGNDWKQVYYELLARNFGMKVNAVPFEMVARTLPLSIITKHIDQPLQVEALLFGQAGMLEEDLVDAYPKKIQNEFNFLRSKYELNPIGKSTWKFMRMRPANFPTIRLAQLASFLNKNKGLADLIFTDFSISHIKEAFNFQISDYWDNHYRFDKVSVCKKKSFGKEVMNNVVINTIVPLLFAYGQHQKSQEIKDKALDILAEIPAEKNGIVNTWYKLGVPSDNAFDSQALIELKNEFCIQKKCLNCNVGVNLLKHVVLND